MHATILLGLALAVAAPAPKAAPKKEPTLVGKWLGETSVQGGQPQAPMDGEVVTFAADGSVAIQSGKAKEVVGTTYTSDAKKSPAEFELVMPGAPPGMKPCLGIYKIDGDTLTLCFNVEGERPTKFESPAGSKAMLVTLKRVKEEK